MNGHRGVVLAEYPMPRKNCALVVRSRGEVCLVSETELLALVASRFTDEAEQFANLTVASAL
jgi:hypothetical protein